MFITCYAFYCVFDSGRRRLLNNLRLLQLFMDKYWGLLRACCLFPTICPGMFPVTMFWLEWGLLELLIVCAFIMWMWLSFNSPDIQNSLNLQVIHHYAFSQLAFHLNVRAWLPHRIWHRLSPSLRFFSVWNGSWLPDMVTLLGRFIGEPTPIRSTVKKSIAEFRRTHSDTWAYQKSSFSEEQLEVHSFWWSSLSLSPDRMPCTRVELGRESSPIGASYLFSMICESCDCSSQMVLLLWCLICVYLNFGANRGMYCWCFTDDALGAGPVRFSHICILFRISSQKVLIWAIGESLVNFSNFSVVPRRSSSGCYVVVES